MLRKVHRSNKVGRTDASGSTIHDLFRTHDSPAKRGHREGVHGPAGRFIRLRGQDFGKVELLVEFIGEWGSRIDRISMIMRKSQVELWLRGGIHLDRAHREKR